MIDYSKDEDLKSPDYIRIFKDMIQIKYPEKEKECQILLNKKKLSSLDILLLNEKIFGIENRETQVFNQVHRSYDKEAIAEILEYQKKNKLNNSEVANNIKMSRNTIAKWKKIFGSSR
ncbi:helix-turn-helix domain-containing protein [Chryseobacterium sp. MEBOG07]|uniref:helix-turn-helix domain-containing protein n=1 Tax=Chryseobacterium sp. MEBOG07 TaxID=2879939 RepID=UPI001F47E99D|nr:helix-turn-helix domain-containing protein [Chryseobacterium sp. MEBOG07]UKB77667.1 helix-turn-helix domain-containing protein [Chryseobacterium sp. MEBOG07]